MKAKAKQKDEKPVVNFAILDNVENYTETSGKFRTKCSSFKIPGQDSGSASALYFPYCDKQRFNFGPFLNDMRGHGVFTPHETGKRWAMMDFILFREHFHDIHCPPLCRGYRNRRVLALSARAKWLGKVIDPIENVRAFIYAYVVDVFRKMGVLP